MEPKVTFVIAHHNYQQYLTECIQSALNQTYKNIHVCVVDDCSKDQKSVYDIVQQTCGEFTNTIEGYYHNHYENDIVTYIELHKQEGSYHQAYARNRGIEACWDNTDIFAILDADDENYPTKIERCVEVLQSDPRIGAVYTDTNIVLVDSKGNPYRKVREYRQPYDYFTLLRECIIHSGCVIKKEALEAVLENGKVFDELLPPVEDYDLWIRIAEKYLFYHIPEPLVYVRVHQNNSTNTSTHEHRMARMQRIFQKRTQRLS